MKERMLIKGSFLVLGMIFILLFSSFDDPQKKAIGKWKSVDEAGPFSMDLEFRADHSFSMKMLNDEIKGKWHIEFDRRICRLTVIEENDKRIVELHDFSIKGDSLSYLMTKNSPYRFVLLRMK